MKCVAARKDDFNNVKLYAEYSHDAVAGLNPITLAEHKANVKLTLPLGVKATPATPKHTAKASPKVLAKPMPKAVADVRGATPAGSDLPGKPGDIVTFQGQQYEARFFCGTVLKVPTFLKGEPSSTDRCTTITGMLLGRFQDQRPLGFDEDYFVDVRQLCDNFNRKTRSNIGYRTLLKIFACDPKCRFTVLAIKHPSAAENNQEWVVIKVRASQAMPAASMLMATSADISRRTLARSDCSFR